MNYCTVCGTKLDENGQCPACLAKAEKRKKTTRKLCGAVYAAALLAVLLLGWYTAQPVEADLAETEPSFTASKYDEAGTCGEDVYWGFFHDTGKLVITGSGMMDDYTLLYEESTDTYSTDAPWYGLPIATVELDGVRVVGRYAFYGCKELTQVVFSDELYMIAEGAFLECEALTELNLPESLEYIEAFAFAECFGLQDIVLPDRVKMVGDKAFASISSLNSVKLSESLTYLGAGAFHSCYTLSEISTIPAGVTYIGENAFFSVIGLREIKVAEDNPNYKDVDGVLFTKDGKTLLQYPNLRSLEPYAVPDGVTKIEDNAFYFCGGLQGISFPESLKTIGEYAFYSCEGLKELTLPQGLSILGEYAFAANLNMKTIHIPASVIQIAQAAFAPFSEYDVFTQVTYGGTKQQWETVQIGAENNKLTTAAITFAE